MWTFFFDFQYGFRSSFSIQDLLKFVSNRNARIFNGILGYPSCSTWYIQGFRQGLACLSSSWTQVLRNFKSNKWLYFVFFQQPVHAGVPQGSIIGPAFFLLYINELPNDVIWNNAINADNSTLYFKGDQAFVFELESTFRDTIGWGWKWLTDFNGGKTDLVSFDESDNFGATDMKMDGSVPQEKSYFKMIGLSFFSKLD